MLSYLGVMPLSCYIWTMNNAKYRKILYFISIVILLTLCVQGYWSYKNYESEKRQLITDVQISLDNAVDAYYTQLAKQNTLSYISSISIDSVFTEVHLANIFFKGGSLGKEFRKVRFNDSSSAKKISVIKSSPTDSFNFKLNANTAPVSFKNNDSISIPRYLEMLTSKIVVSFSEDSLSLDRIDNLIKQELNRKNIAVTYGLSYKINWNKKQTLRPNNIDSSMLKASAGSSFLIEKSSLEMHYDNITRTVLQRNATSMILSLLLVSSIIICLLYLLKIIKHQKQLAEVKNDLINNITHEFKTPIATIGVAMEAIQGFNNSRDPEKNIRYAKISQEQVEKLNGMVEKLLETATLDSEQLRLNFEEHDLIELLKKATTKEAFSDENKTIIFNPSEERILYKIDIFHFENAVNNIIDNAIKYGGNEISVDIKKEKGSIVIVISDSGTSLTEHHRKQVFEKFYRVPKGNTHDVKGFGIGLYYAKKIIEKHHGTITLHVNKQTTFIINLPIAPKN